MSLPLLHLLQTKICQSILLLIEQDVGDDLSVWILNLEFV